MSIGDRDVPEPIACGLVARIVITALKSNVRWAHFQFCDTDISDIQQFVDAELITLYNEGHLWRDIRLVVSPDEEKLGCIKLAWRDEPLPMFAYHKEPR